MSGSAEVADQARIDGTYLMTAVAETKPALAQPGEDYTAFTGALIDTLLNGLLDGPDLLDLETVFKHVRADLTARNRPVPQRRTRNDGNAIALARNRRRLGATRATTDRPVRRLPQPPAEFADRLQGLTPLELDREVGQLRTDGHDQLADALLRASAALRDDQEVAAIVEVLHRQGRPGDLRIVLAAGAGRAPGEVLGIVDALRATDQQPQATELLLAVADGPAEDIAGLTRILRSAGREDELNELVAAALEAARRRSTISDLVGALWLAGLTDEVDNLLRRAAGMLPRTAVVELADELREVGLQQGAFGLYASAPDVVAARGPATVAQLCAACEQPPVRAIIAEAGIAAAVTPSGVLDLAESFWDTGQHDWAERTVTSAAANMDNADVVTLAAALRGIGRDEAAYRLCLLATTTRPVSAIKEIIGALRAAGRPVTANKLVEATIRQAPVTTVAALIAEWNPDDRGRLLLAILEREPSDVATLLDELQTTSPVTADQLIELIVTLSRETVKLLPVAIDRLHPQGAEETLRAIATSGTGEELADLIHALHPDRAAFLFFQIVCRGKPPLGEVLALLRTGETRSDPIVSLLTEQPPERIGPALTGLRQAGFAKDADAALHTFCGPDRTDHQITTTIASLHTTGSPSEGNRLLGHAMTGRSMTRLTHLVDALRDLHNDLILAAAAEWVRSNHASIGDDNVDWLLRKLGMPVVKPPTRRFWPRHKGRQ